MKKILFTCVAVLLLTSLSAQQRTLSADARVSVITCSPGQNELYSAFGHSAIRVYDSLNRFDIVFNYGIFNFDQPYFYLNFTRGYLYYQVAAYPYENFEFSYLSDNRTIHEQELNLTSSQNQKLFDYLAENVKEENKVYRYDYFYNNCATKIRDVMINVFGDSIAFDYSFIKTNYTIRQLTDVYIEEQQPWGDLGIDICLGLPMDKPATPYEYMFLPDYIESCFDHATIKKGDTRVPLVKNKHDNNSLIHKEWEAERKSSLDIHPRYAMMAFAVICIALGIFDWFRKKRSYWFDAFLFGVTGLIGILLTVLWFFTDHGAAAKNFNLLWAFPFNLFAALLIRREGAWIKFYFLFIAILSVVTLLVWKVIPQDLHYALIPLVIGIAARAFIQFYLRTKAD